MIKFIIAGILSLAAFNTQAEVMAVATHPGNLAIFELRDDKGLCIGEALQGFYRPISGDAVEGCWRFVGDGVQMVFLDGDIAQIPAELFSAPTKI